MSFSNSDTDSNTNTSSTTEQKDQRVSATDNAVALGAGATLSANDEFSDNVKEAFDELIKLTRDVGMVAIGFAEKAQGVTESALGTVANRAEKSEEIENADKVFLLRALSIAGIGVIGVIAINLIQKGKLFK